MTTKQRILSNLAIPPGEYLQEVLEDMEMTQAELARRMNRPTQAINEIIKGHKAITPETAIQLANVTRVPDNIWLGLEEKYQLTKARQQEQEQLNTEINVISSDVYLSLANLNYVKDISGKGQENKRNRVRELRRFFGVASLSNIRNVQTYAAAFRVSQVGKISPYALAAWLRCGELEALELEMQQYSEKRLRKIIPELRRLTHEDSNPPFQTLQAKLAECGVAFVLVKHLPKTKAQGATFWLSPSKVVLQMTLRYKWADIFWFSFFHELGHILLHGKRQVFVDEIRGNVYHDAKAQQMEEEADDFARNTLIPPEPYRRFVEASDFSAQAIQMFAEDIGIALGIVVGRLQHDSYLDRNEGQNLRHQYELAS